MAPRQAKQNVVEIRRQPSVLEDHGKRPQGIRKEQPQISCRRSVRQEEIQRQQGRTISKRNTKQKQPTLGKELPQILSTSVQAEDRKQKRSQEFEDPLIRTPAKRLQKQLQTSIANSVVETTSSVTNNETNPIDYWREHGCWPKEYFQQDDQVRKDFKKDFEEDSWYEEYWVPEMNMNNVLARKKSTFSLRGKQPEVGSATPSSITPSDQKEVKKISYLHQSYETMLATKGSFMKKSNEDINKASNDLCHALLHLEQTHPHDSLFRDDLFNTTCEKINDRNETMVIRDIGLLIVPSAQILATYGSSHLNHLIESVNEGWKSAIAFYGPCPQPDYSVGFGWTAFTKDQFRKLEPFVGENPDYCNSYFMATFRIYFPFLTCEVKYGAAALYVADRQNAHNMTLAVRSVVELFRLVGREKELHREILAFSISHDNCLVRIYGHYPIINGKDTTYYRHPIHDFNFQARDGIEKWTAYKFTKNVYDIWMPMHFKRICSVIDQIPPDINFEVSELQSSEASGLSQVLGDQSLSQLSNPDTTSLARNNDSQSNLIA